MTLNVNEHYFHSMTGHYRFSLNTLSSILESGYIKSIKEIDPTTSKTYGMHRTDEICLSEYTNAKVSDTTSAFSLFVATSPTLILDKDIKTYKPFVWPSGQLTDAMLASGEYTNIYDEVRTNISVATSHIVGLSFPLTELLKDDFRYLFYTNEMFFNLATSGVNEFFVNAIMNEITTPSSYFKTRRLRRILNQIRAVLKEHKTDIPIYDFHQEDEQPVFELLRR